LYSGHVRYRLCGYRWIYNTNTLERDVGRALVITCSMTLQPKPNTPRY